MDRWEGKPDEVLDARAKREIAWGAIIVFAVMLIAIMVAGYFESDQGRPLTHTDQPSAILPTT